MGRRDKGKPRGRMTAYAFFVKSTRENMKLKNPGQTVSFIEFTKWCGETWKSLPPIDKKGFKELADKDKIRYDLEMKEYAKETKHLGTKLKRRPKDPNQPKRSLSGFFWFCNDERPKVKGQNPEFGVGEIAKILGKLWSETDIETKNAYKVLADRDKERYQREMAEYNKRKKESG